MNTINSHVVYMREVGFQGYTTVSNLNLTTQPTYVVNNY